MVRFGFLQGCSQRLAETENHSEVIRIYEIRDFNIFVSFAFFLWDHFLDQFFNLECEISKFAKMNFQTVKWLPSSSCSQILKRFGPIGQIPGLGLHSWSGSSSLELVPQPVTRQSRRFPSGHACAADYLLFLDEITERTQR